MGAGAKPVANDFRQVYLVVVSESNKKGKQSMETLTTVHRHAESK
jgi:hypothetical protein